MWAVSLRLNILESIVIVVSWLLQLVGGHSGLLVVLWFSQFLYDFDVNWYAYSESSCKLHLSRYSFLWGLFRPKKMVTYDYCLEPKYLRQTNRILSLSNTLLIYKYISYKKVVLIINKTNVLQFLITFNHHLVCEQCGLSTHHI